MRKKGKFLLIILGSLFIFLAGSASVSAQTSSGLCTLGMDSCNNFTGEECALPLCGLKQYANSSETSLYGNISSICISQIGNKCFGKSYTECLFLIDCRWYGVVPVVSSESNESGENIETPFPEFPKDQVISEEAPVFIGRIINIAMGLVGSLALIMFIFGGISWMTAGGNEQKVKESIGIITWSMLGLVVVFLSYVLVKLLLNNVI
jgi:hypothetical protein